MSLKGKVKVDFAALLRTHAFRALIGLLIMIVLIVPIRTSWEAAINSVLVFMYANPIVTMFLVFIALTLVTSIIHAAKETKITSIAIKVFAFLTVLSIVSGIWAVFNADPMIGLSIDVEKVESLPDMSNASLRLIPMSVARRYALDTLQLPQHTLWGSPLIKYEDGRPVWMFPLVPDGFWNELTQNGKGFFKVPMDTVPPHVEPRISDWVIFPRVRRYYGLYSVDIISQILRGTGVWGAYIDFSNAFFSEYGGREYYIIPVVRWVRDIHPLIARPVPDGVVVIDPEGNIEYLSYDEALNDPRTEGAPLVPDWVARFYIERLNMREGMWNYWFIHRNQFEIQDLSGENKQPFLLRTDDGRIIWLFAVEPWGRAHGIYKLMWMDARSRELKVYEYSLETPLIGPVKSIDYLRSNYPRYDWTSMIPEEPIPMIFNGRLYWRIVVTTAEKRGIVLIALVDADTGKVIEYEVAPTPEEPTDVLGYINQLKDRIQEEIQRLQQIYEDLIKLEELLTGNSTTTTPQG
jgi:hypothetical protein